MKFTDKELSEIRECLELLRSIESVEYHNKNWLPNWAIKSPKKLSEAKLRLIDNALTVVGPTSGESVY